MHIYLLSELTCQLTTWGSAGPSTLILFLSSNIFRKDCTTLTSSVLAWHDTIDTPVLGKRSKSQRWMTQHDKSTLEVWSATTDEEDIFGIPANLGFHRVQLTRGYNWWVPRCVSALVGGHVIRGPVRFSVMRFDGHIMGKSVLLNMLGMDA